MSLTERAFKAGAWTFAFRSAARGVGFVRNIALARILAPDDIGLFGIVLVILSIIERFTETGLESALVQKRGRIEEYLDSAWTVLALRRIALAGVLVLVAPSVASFFGEMRAAPLVQVLGLSIFIHAFANVGVLHFRRELEMKRQFIHGFSGTVADLLVSVTLALYLRSAWALMFGLLVNRTVSVIVSYAIHPYRPRLRIDWAQTRELGRFGRWVFGNKLLTFIAYRGDNLVVGKVLGAPALGIYMLAFSISETVTVEISRMINSVAFPAYSRVQHKSLQVRKAFLIATELVASVSLPVAVGMAFLATPLVLSLLGERWLEVAAILPPLAFAGSVRAITANASVASKGLGRPEHTLQRSAVQVAAMYTAMIPLMYFHGLVGLSLAVLVGAVAPLPLVLRNSQSLLGVTIGSWLRVLLPAVVLSSAVAMVLVGTSQIGVGDSVTALLLRVVLAGSAYLAVATSLWFRYQTGPLRILSLYRGRQDAVNGSDVRSQARSASGAPGQV